MTTATLCPSCGETVAEEDDFCESCGTRLHAPPPQEGICPKCGVRIEIPLQKAQTAEGNL